MGVLYTITPTTGEVADWLVDTGVTLPVGSASRFPLIAEIRDVLDSLEGFTSAYDDNGIGSSWQAMIMSIEDPESGAWTRLNITCQKDPSEPQDIWFEKGYPELIVRIVSRLAEMCGTLVVIPDTGCPPLVVLSGADPIDLCAHWPHLKNEDAQHQE
jgi:hypothetical protein